MTPVLRVCRDPAALFEAAAGLFAEQSVEAVRARGCFRVALSGGSTPRGLFARLAAGIVQPPVPWPQIDWWWGDERHVPPDDPQSNYRMAAETLLDRVPIDRRRIHRFAGEDPDAAGAARAYERDLVEAFELAPGERPRFDLVLLGLGTDGHTASLFPGTAALAERDRLVVANAVPAMRTTRLTMTLPVFNAARLVVFLVAGADKASILERVLGGAEDLPARRVRPADGEVIWLVDDAAARGLATPR
ncbi:MAG TPA: 6-phosphogluconolactonase [Vicinamibacterales bacterium]|nr:6-phosphogluconolactonase [Vicinamibacterales bacterium]